MTIKFLGFPNKYLTGEAMKLWLAQTSSRVPRYSSGIALQNDISFGSSDPIEARDRGDQMQGVTFLERAVSTGARSS